MGIIYKNGIKYGGGDSYIVEDKSLIPVIGTQTSSTGSWTGNIDIPHLYNGLTIAYFLPYAPSGNATLNLTLSDGSTTGPINCYYNTSRLTTHYGKGSNIIMTFWGAGSISVDGTATTDDRWIAHADYNTDATGYYLRRIYPNLKAGTNKIFPYTIIMQNADGRWESLVTSSTVNSTKTRNTHGFRLGQVLLMYANATYNADELVGTYNIWTMHSGLIDHRYSFNTENNATKGTTGYKPVYLVGIINNTDGLFYLDETWWTQTLPSTDNGKVYIYIGDAYDYYRMTFVDTQKFYKYINGALREISQDAITANGHIVNKDVPSDAVFTDTTYSAGNGLTLTGTSFNVGKRWSAVSQGQKWSRLYAATPVVSYVGTSGFLNITATRDSVVVNASFLVTSSHASTNYVHITQIDGNNYTTIRVRGVAKSNGEYYFEIYDTAQGIASGTTQSWNCCFIPLADTILTTYTTFTDGSTIPSGYSAFNDFTTTQYNDASAIKNISRSGTTFTATKQDGSTFTFDQQGDYLKLSGGTLTGNFYVSGATEKRISLKNPTNSSLEVYMASTTIGNHGLYSTGYLNGTTYTQGGKWLVKRDSDGKVYFNGFTIESSVPSDAVFTDEKVKLTTPSVNSSTTYYIPFKPNINTSPNNITEVYGNNGLQYITRDGTAENVEAGIPAVDGYSILKLGNQYAIGTNGNRYGQLRIYSKGTKYGSLIQGDITGNITHTLPDTGDELVNLSATQTLTNKTLQDCFFFKTKATSSDLDHPDILLTEEFVDTDKYSFRLNMTSGQINYQWTQYNGNTNTKKVRDTISIGLNGNITIANDTYTPDTSVQGRKLILGSGSVQTSNAAGTKTTTIVENGITTGVISATTTTSTDIYTNNLYSSGSAIVIKNTLSFASGTAIKMADKIAMQIYKENNVNCLAVGIDTMKVTLYGSSYYLSSGAAITSDKRLKTNIEIVDNRYLNLIKNLEPKRFKLKNNPEQKYHTGFIAQDVQELLKKYNINEEEFAAFARPKGDDSEYALSYTEFIPLLLLYIKDLEKQIKEIKEQQ